MAARILVIEDNATNLELMCYLLSAFGYEPLKAVNGIEGVAMARRERPDLIACDIHLPKMDGYEVARELKKDQVCKSIPLVAVTALAMVGDQEKVLQAGFDGYISKPIDPQTFVKQIEKYLPANRTTNGLPKVAPAGQVSTATVPRRGAVLVLDNLAVNRLLLSSTLEPVGYTVTLTETAADALLSARRSPPDLFLSDMHMPGQNGLEFLRAVKSDDRLCRIPFIFLTSSVWGESERTEAQALGADRFIVRPIEPSQLLIEIDSCLVGKQGT
jgi:two-component system, cell cycle response regulator